MVRSLPEHEPHHRNIQSGGARAAIFGLSDGLVTNVALILGVAGAHPGGTVVRLTGLAGLVAGAFSMAAGEYVSMQAQRELLEHELDVEREALQRTSAVERSELAAIYEHRGIPRPLALELVELLMRDPDIALETHAREELGITPTSLGSPVIAALSSFVTFALGALLPLIPWLITSGDAALGASIGVGTLCAAAAGFVLGVLTGRSRTRSALRQLAVAAVAAAITFAVGSAVGVVT